MSIWINKKRKNNIYSTGKHWVNHACVSAPACREREEGGRGLICSQLLELVIEYL